MVLVAVGEQPGVNLRQVLRAHRGRQKIGLTLSISRNIRIEVHYGPKALRNLCRHPGYDHPGVTISDEHHVRLLERAVAHWVFR